MKTILHFLIATLCTFVIIDSIAQTPVVVNNTPGIKADFASLQVAVDNVPAGTLILLQPGPSTYGDVYIHKRVCIIGAGYFLGENAPPYTQARLASSVVDRVFFDSLSNGTYLTGLSITGQIDTGVASRLNFKNTSNITVSRCLISRTDNPAYSIFCVSDNCSTITFKQCYFKGGVNLYLLQSNKTTGVEFHNNIFDTENLIMPGESSTTLTASVLFQNNVMFSLVNPGAFPSALTFINNIIFQNTLGSGSGTIDAVAATHNISNVPFSVAGTNNTSANFTDVFILNSDPTTPGGQEYRFKLKAGSPAVGFGQTGEDCGIFGGNATDYYVLSGISEFVPNIFFLNVPTVGTSTGGLPVHLKIKANQ